MLPVNAPSPAIELINKIQGGFLSIADFLKECAYWVVNDNFDELMPKPLPSEPNSHAYREYKTWTTERKAKTEPKFYLDNPEIPAYFDQKLLIKNLNLGNVWWLNEILKNIPEEDILTVRKIKDRLMKFKMAGWQI